jgi:L-fuculose-phosphate aldolase
MGADDKKVHFHKTEQDMALALPDSGWSLRQKHALAARILAKEGHGAGLAGQVTVGHDANTFWTLTFGLMFDEATAGNAIRIDHDINVVEGDGMANPANRFHAWVYRARPDAGAIVHTHAPWCSALSMVGEPLAIAHMDATPLYDDVAYLPEWPGIPLADDEGRIIAEALGGKRAILLAHHGLLTLGKTIEEATVLAVFMERAAALHMRARSLGAIKPIAPVHARESHDFLLKPLIVNATFNGFARAIVREAPEVLL